MSIYTRAGDKGKTSLKNGRKVLKSNIRLEALGSIDELNSSLGLIVSSLKQADLKKELLKIQNDLFEVGGQLASPSTNKDLDIYLEQRIKDFENLIDKYSQKLPILKNFILPGGSTSASFIHLARTICRRGERVVVKLAETENINKNIIACLNRLSDLLFTMARLVNKIEKKKETEFRK